MFIVLFVLEISIGLLGIFGYSHFLFGIILLLPQTGTTINMVSLFAYIVTLGIVVDDAIIVGENIFEERKKGGLAECSSDWCEKMNSAVTFAVLTTIVAFSPLLFVPGVSGKFFGLIPLLLSAYSFFHWSDRSCSACSPRSFGR